MYNLILQPQTIPVISPNMEVDQLTFKNNLDLFFVSDFNQVVFSYSVALTILIRLPFLEPRVIIIILWRTCSPDTLSARINPEVGFFGSPLQRTRVPVFGVEGIPTFGRRKQCDEWFTRLHQGCDILHNDSRPCQRHLSGRASTKKAVIYMIGNI